jgi:site-specific DNA recombinase
VTQKSAAVYVRISDDREGKAAGVKRQEADCREVAKAKGWAVAEVYSDNSISASNGHERPAYQRLLADIRERKVEAVIAQHPDRLHRSPRELEDFIDAIESAKATVVTVRAGEVDLSTATGRQTARIVGSIARGESERMGERIRRKHEEIAQQGRISGGGSRPFGYRRDRITIDTVEARLIRKAATSILAGDSLRAIARDWNAAGVRTTQGKQWRPNVLRRILVSGRISGQREHHGEIVSKAEWPAIISPTLARRLRALLDAPGRKTYSTFIPKSYLLGGFLKCGVCGARLRSRGRPHGARAYACKGGPGFEGKGCVQIAAEPLEELVVRSVFEVLDTPALARAIAAVQRDTADDEVEDTAAADEEQLAQLARDFADRRVTRAEWLTARDAVQHRLDAGQARAAKSNGTTAIGQFVGKSGALAKAWPGLSLDRRRSIVAAVLDSVVVKPANRKGKPTDGKGHPAFDVERVTPFWRF